MPESQAVACPGHHAGGDGLVELRRQVTFGLAQHRGDVRDRTFNAEQRRRLQDLGHVAGQEAEPPGDGGAQRGAGLPAEGARLLSEI